MRSAFAVAVALYLLHSDVAHATSLRAAPARLDLIAPDSAATLSLRNEEARPITVQIRVFRWSQADGIERLEPTTEVVASPPMTTVGPNAEYTVRVVRVSKAPVAGEESYRLLIDELPDRSRRVPGAITFVLRYSIPVFFASRDVSQPQVTWGLQSGGDAIVLSAKNTGGRHLRIADLELADGGTTVAARSGLVGYVLAGSVMHWSLPRTQDSSISGRSVELTAQSDAGAINATAVVQSGR